MHPSGQLQREYAVRVIGKLSQADLRQLRQGIVLEDGMARCDKINFSGGNALNRWYRVVVSQGRYRIVRRLFNAMGCTVSRLIRIRYGPVFLPRYLQRGEYRLLSSTELQSLRDAAAEPANGK
jgi:23S rRNA pseudouridine2605 synthase